MESLTIPSVKEPQIASETDSLPRLSVRDLFIALSCMEGGSSTLEELRLQLCKDRKKPRRGDFLFSTARDAAVEFHRLGLIEGGPFPKDRRAFERLRSNALRLTEEGYMLKSLFQKDRAVA